MSNVVELRPDRSRTIGGSDIAAAAGIHPYVSPVMLWLQKTGRVEVAKTEAMRWGTLLEPLVIDYVSDYMTVRAVTDSDPVVGDESCPWARGTLDAYVSDGSRWGVLEVKTANGWAHSAWNGDVPVQYAAQCQWYMHLTGLDWSMLAVLVGGQHLETRIIDRDDRAIGLLLEAGERFYGHLVADTPPPPDGSSSTRDALAAMFPKAQGGRVRLLGADWEAFRELRSLRAQAKALEAQIAEREAIVKLAMGDAETAISPDDKEVAHWRNVQARRLDTSALREQRPELADMFTTTTTTRRFTVT